MQQVQRLSNLRLVLLLQDQQLALHLQSGGAEVVHHAGGPLPSCQFPATLTAGGRRR